MFIRLYALIRFNMVAEKDYLPMLPLSVDFWHMPVHERARLIDCQSCIIPMATLRMYGKSYKILNASCSPKTHRQTVHTQIRLLLFAILMGSIVNSRHNNKHFS